MRNIIIGAFDGISFDDIFYKLQENDEVVFVEPIPHYFKLLKLNSRKLASKCHFENCAISDKNEQLEMAYIDENFVNDYAAFYKGCSSVVIDGEPLNRYLQKADHLHLNKIKVKAITFDELCQKYGFDFVDYVQIDCEGFDEKIISSIDLNKYNINKVKFETHYLSKNFISDFSAKWSEYRYEITEGDVIFTKL